GLRYIRGGLSFEAIGFYTHYSNLVGICSNAVGCTSGQIGDQFNGGRAGVKGLELSGSYLVAVADGLNMPISFNYTFTEARFRSTFSDGFWGDVTAGDRLPYIPPHQAYASVGLEGLSWDLTFSLNFTAPTRNRAGSGPIPRLQRIDGRTVFDLAFGYDFGDRIRLFASLENLFDETYVVARRPYGPRPGKPRSFQAGLELSF
ncbi:MAG: TonB-dependent receptor, partial [Sphingomonadales bacterium]